MKLSEAEVVVTTQQQIEQASGKGDWFHLAEYGDAGEFYNACCLYFPEECNPLFRYPAWENIPDALINEQWFSPNFFEFRDAVERIDEEEIDYFLKWCEYHGHNIADDDPHQLVAHFQEIHTSYPEFEYEEPDIPVDTYSYQNPVGTSCNTERYCVEVFDDNYD